MRTANELSTLSLSGKARRIVEQNRVPLDAIPVEGGNVVGIAQVLVGLRTERDRIRSAGGTIPVDVVVGGRGVDAAVLPPLEEYQIEVLDRFLGSDGLPLSGTLDAPPGFGKTYTSLHVAKRQPGAVLILAPTTIARDQWCGTLRSCGVSTFVLGEDTVFHWGEYGAIVATYWLVTTRQTVLSRDLASNLSKVLTVSYGTLILDEVHRMPTPIFSTVCHTVFRRTTIGCTATLARSDGRIDDLDALIGGPLRFSIDYATLTDQGVFPEVEDRVLSVPLHDSFAACWDGDYSRQMLSTLNPNKLSAVLQIVRDLGQKTIVFCDWVRALDPIVSFLRKALHHVRVLDSLSGVTSAQERRSILLAFKSLHTGVLVISRVGEMALDVPDAQVCIQMSHTKSMEAAVQRRGRITRRSDGKHPKSYILVTDGTPEAQNTKASIAASIVQEVDAGTRIALLAECRKKKVASKVKKNTTTRKRRRLPPR